MEVTVLVEGMRRYTIHGQPYVVFYFSHRDDPDTIHHAQLSADQLPDGLRVGDEACVLYVAGVVAAVHHSPSSSA